MGRSSSPFEGKPDLVDASFIHKGQSEISLYLQLLNPQTISGLYYEVCDNFLHLDFLNRLAEAVTMKKVDQFESLVHQYAREYDFKGEIFPLVIMGLTKIADEITGRNLQQDIETVPGEKLVCRCFGISEKQIMETLEVAETPSLKLITDETMAGGGCGTCLKDLKVLLSFHLPTEDQILSSKGMTEIQFIKKLNAFMLENNSSLEIARVVGTDVWVKTDELNPWPEIEKLQQLSKESLSLPLCFHLFK